MKQLRSLITLLIISSAMAVALPLFDMVYLYPSMTSLIMHKTTRDTEQLAKLLTISLDLASAGAAERLVADSTLQNLRRMATKPGLMRISLRSPAGEVLLSSDPTQLGRQKDLAALQRVFAKGEGFSRLYTVSLAEGEGERVASLVESLAPIRVDGQAVGVLELIQDISDTRQELDRAVSRASSYLLVAPVLFLAVIVFISMRARQALWRQEQAELQLQDSREELAQKHQELGQLFSQVEQAKSEWQVTLDCIAEMVLLVDRDGQVRRCNESFARFVGQPYLGVLGKNWQKLLFTEGVEVVSFNQQYFEVYHRERKRWLILNFYPHQDEQSGTGLTVITIRQQEREEEPSGEEAGGC